MPLMQWHAEISISLEEHWLEFCLTGYFIKHTFNLFFTSLRLLLFRKRAQHHNLRLTFEEYKEHHLKNRNLIKFEEDGYITNNYSLKPNILENSVKCSICVLSLALRVNTELSCSDLSSSPYIQSDEPWKGNMKCQDQFWWKTPMRSFLHPHYQPTPQPVYQ